jgi:malonate transporter MadL subunit
MIIYGVAVLGACLLTGMLAGEILGAMLGVQANVGGVGIAMLLLVLVSNTPRLRSLTHGTAGAGIQFWSAMYIPIVVAMAGRQNVAGALDGGLLAIVAGASTVALSFALVPLISRIGRAAPENARADREDEP